MRMDSWNRLRLRRALVLGLLPFAPIGAAADPPLRSGEIVIVGDGYPGAPGLCDGRVCRVDPSTGVATPIGDPVPSAAIVDLAVESATSVLLLQVTTSFPQLGSVLRLDVPSGAVTPLASGFPSRTEGEIVVTPSGRIFSLGAIDTGIHEIDPVSGAVSLLVAGAWYSLALERNGMLLTTLYAGCDPIFCQEESFEFVRIDPDAPTPVPLGEIVSPGAPTRVVVGGSGERVIFMNTTPFQDGLVIRWTPSGSVGLFVDESLNGMAFDAMGQLWVGSYDPGVAGVPEIRSWSVDPMQLVASFDQDFGVGPIDVGLPACRDGLDNDGDGGIDWDGGATGAVPDAQCVGKPWRDRETTTGGCGLGAELVVALGLLVRTRRQV